MPKNKDKGIQIQVKDTISKKSKSFTVHNLNMDDLFRKILNYVFNLQKYENVKLVCYKGDVNGKEKTSDKRAE